MTMLEVRDGDTRSYLDLAEVIEQSSPSATADLSQLWRRIALNVLISNTDDHLRNHGFLHTSGDSWRLSPAFDLNPNPQPGQKYLSTAIDRTDSRASITTLLSVRTKFRLTLDAAVTILSEVAYFVSTWRAVATGIGLGKQELESMKSAFEHDEFKEACRITSK
jgi:serine/threonine-protein kinase HipA